MNDFIDELFATLQERKRNPTPNSYTASLLTAGEDEIVKKIGEEAVEVILAAKGQGDQRIVEETADLIYHLLVLLVSRGLGWDDIRAELKQRHQ
ncbi:MAG: phosphoribosyl-ATP diphosphatase [Anaerolineaceae bacterium]|nr:phosphoribosyl-ATP diphosphatase [Anaerolineaceae bacterium]